MWRKVLYISPAGVSFLGPCRFGMAINQNFVAQPHVKKSYNMIVSLNHALAAICYPSDGQMRSMTRDHD
jgi:hypothetical protein